MKTIQVHKLEFDLNPIKEIISESKNAQQFILNFEQGKIRPTKELTHSIRTIKENHKKISKQFEKNKQLIQKLSPAAAKRIAKQLGQLDEMISNLPGTKSRKLVMCIGLHFMVFDYSNLEEDYGKFGAEMRIYLELIKNASKQA